LVFLEIAIFGEKHAVLEIKHIQLVINGNVFHQLPLQGVKSPKAPYHYAPLQSTAIQKYRFSLRSSKHLCSYIIKFSFLGLCCEIGLNDGAL
jgi:hypothetical protein